VCVNDNVAEPLPPAVPVVVEAVVPSPQFTVPLNISFAGAVHVRVAATLWPTCILVGVALRLQLGGGVVETVMATEAGLTVPANAVVVSVTVALTESVGLLAVA
jgi:hypothetical protein